MSWRIGVLIGIALAGVAAGFWLPRRPATSLQRDAPLYLVASGDTGGWIVPCGCTSNQSGGLLRRGTFLGRFRGESDVLYVDAGGAPGGTSPYQRVKFEAVLRGELAMNVAAHNLGRPEAALGADYLRQTAAELQVPFVSANLRDGQGKFVGLPVQLMEQGSLRFAVTGVLSRRHAAAGIQIDDPREAILRAIAGVKGRYDSLIVLAYVPEEELQQLAAGLPEADAILGGPTLADGQAQAQRNRQPILVRATADSCTWCKKLEEEIVQPGVQKELARWTLVLLDVDKSPKDARTLTVAGIPVLKNADLATAVEPLAKVVQKHPEASRVRARRQAGDRPGAAGVRGHGRGR